MATPNIGQQYLDIYKKLSGAQRNAADALIEVFSEYGLQSLAGSIIGFIKQGFGADTISIMLQETPQYKTRFAANDIRRKNGLAPLSPKEYIETERAYRQVLATSGMPKGFYDQQADFQKFIANDLSPAELQTRVQGWQEAATRDQAAVDTLRRLYGMSTSDYAAYLMDPQRALPILQRTVRAVGFATAASRHGYTIDRALSERYGGTYDVSADEAERGFAAIQEVQADTDKLAKMYGLGGYSVEEAAAETFAGDANAGKKRQRAYGAEKATFSDSGRGATGKAQSKNAY